MLDQGAGAPLGNAFETAQAWEVQVEACLDLDVEAVVGHPVDVGDAVASRDRDDAAIGHQIHLQSVQCSLGILRPCHNLVASRDRDVAANGHQVHLQSVQCTVSILQCHNWLPAVATSKLQAWLGACPNPAAFCNLLMIGTQPLHSINHKLAHAVLTSREGQAESIFF